MLRDWWHGACVRRCSRGPMKCSCWALFSRMWSVQGNTAFWCLLTIFEKFLGSFYQFFNLNTVVTVGGGRGDDAVGGRLDVFKEEDRRSHLGLEWLKSEEGAFSLASWDFRECSRAHLTFPLRQRTRLLITRVLIAAPTKGYENPYLYMCWNTRSYGGSPTS